MSNTTPARPGSFSALAVIAAIALGVGSPIAVAAQDQERAPMSSDQALSAKQRSIVPIAAATASGEMSQLHPRYCRAHG